MIREDYKKETKESGLTNKEIEGIKRLGERPFYTTSIHKMTGIIKSLNFSTLFSLIFSSVLLLFIIIVAIGNISRLLTVVGILGTIFTVLTFTWCIIWYAVLKNVYQNKIDDYRERLKLLTDKEIKKRLSAYEKQKNS